MEKRVKRLGQNDSPSDYEELRADAKEKYTGKILEEKLQEIDAQEQQEADSVIDLRIVIRDFDER